MVSHRNLHTHTERERKTNESLQQSHSRRAHSRTNTHTHTHRGSAPSTTPQRNWSRFGHISLAPVAIFSLSRRYHHRRCRPYSLSLSLPLYTDTHTRRIIYYVLYCICTTTHLTCSAHAYNELQIWRVTSSHTAAVQQVIPGFA